MAIEHTYFTSINSYEKAYMLGLIIFNIKENSSDKIIVEIELKMDKIKDTDTALSYNMYNKLNDIDKKNYSYYKNVDKIIEIFKKIGKVQCDNFNILQITIASLYIIKDIFVKHLDLYLVNIKYYDLSLFMNTICNTDKKLLNNFIKAYIEKNARIYNNCVYIKIYNYNTLKQITEIYNTPHKILKEEVDIKEDTVNGEKKEQYVIEYKNSNMIDFLGQIYTNSADIDELYINNSIYNFLNSNDNDKENRPVLKIYKADADAVVPSKNNYSDAGLDLTIIKGATSPDKLQDAAKQFEVELEFIPGKLKPSDALLTEINNEIIIIKQVLENSSDIISKEETEKVIQKEEEFQLHHQEKIQQEGEDVILNDINSLIALAFLLIEEILNNY